MSTHVVDGYTVLATNQPAPDLVIATEPLDTWRIRRSGFEPRREPGRGEACGHGDATSIRRSPSSALACDATRARHSASSAEDIAAQLPVPCAEVADRLLELLFTCEPTRATDEKAA